MGQNNFLFCQLPQVVKIWLTKLLLQTFGLICIYKHSNKWMQNCAANFVSTVSTRKIVTIYRMRTLEADMKFLLIKSFQLRQIHKHNNQKQ